MSDFGVKFSTNLDKGDRKRGLSTIIEDLQKIQRILPYDGATTTTLDNNCEYLCDTTPSSDTITDTPSIPPPKRRRRHDRSNGTTISSTTSNTTHLLSHHNNNNNTTSTDYSSHNYNNNNNNNNSQHHLKHERLSPGTPDTSSRSVTPSSASHPDTPPAQDSVTVTAPLLAARNYSDFMRSLAAKYNNANPNDYFSAATRNGFPPPTLDPRFKLTYPNYLASLSPSTSTKDDLSLSSTNTTSSTNSPNKKPQQSTQSVLPNTDFPSLLNPFLTGVPTTNSPNNPSSIFTPLLDMSSTQTLLALVRTAKEAEMQGLLKSSSSAKTGKNLTDAFTKNVTTDAFTKNLTEAIALKNLNNEGFAKTAVETSSKNTTAELPSAPLDLSAAATFASVAAVANLTASSVTVNNNSSGGGKRLKLKGLRTSPSDGQSIVNVVGKKSLSLTPLQSSTVAANLSSNEGSDCPDDVATWGVDDVCRFVAGIDICAEYVQNFRDQCIDGSGLPLLTEDHLTTTMQMKLGPALKLKSLLAKRMGGGSSSATGGSCTVCQHYNHRHAPSPLTNLGMSVSPNIAVSNVGTTIGTIGTTIGTIGTTIGKIGTTIGTIGTTKGTIGTTIGTIGSTIVTTIGATSVSPIVVPTIGNIRSNIASNSGSTIAPNSGSTIVSNSGSTIGSNIGSTVSTSISLGQTLNPNISVTTSPNNTSGSVIVPSVMRANSPSSNSSTSSDQPLELTSPSRRSLSPDNESSNNKDKSAKSDSRNR